MNHSDLEEDVRLTARRVQDLSLHTPLDGLHQQELHAALMRRHRELATAASASSRRVSRRRVRRLAFMAPPALAAVLAALFLGLQPPGRSPLLVANASGLNAALVRTVPTVTAWQVTVQTQRRDSAGSYQCAVPLQPTQHLFIENGQPYLFSAGTWWRVTYNQSRGSCPFGYQWAFAQIATHLVHHDYVVIATREVNGLSTIGIRYASRRSGRQQIVVTAWVDRATGLVAELQRQILQGTRVLESDSASYSYQRTK